MEILLVTAILVAMASMAGYAYVSMQRNMTSRNTRNRNRVIGKCVHGILQLGQALPESLRELQAIPQGMDQTTWGGPYIDVKKDLLDPWQTEYKYSVDEASLTVTISSAGPDRNFNSADDISN